MRKMVAISGLVSALFVLSACGQAPQLPDYTEFTKVKSGKVLATIDGQQVDLEAVVYQHVDMIKLERESVYLYNKENLPWLALYHLEIGEEQPGGAITTKDESLTLFENKDGKWKFIKDLSEEDIRDFLKRTYKLEFKMGG